MSQKVEQSLFEATICFVGKLDRLGRDLRHLVNTVHDLTARDIGFKVLTGHGASIDTISPSGKLKFGIFAALVEIEREPIIERTRAGMAAALRPWPQWWQALKDRPLQAAPSVVSMNQPKTRIGDLFAELGMTLWMRRSIRRSDRSALPNDMLSSSGGWLERLLWIARMPPLSAAAPLFGSHRLVFCKLPFNLTPARHISHSNPLNGLALKPW